MKPQKINLLFFILFVSLIACKDDPDPVQLLINGNVETGTTYPDNWWYSSGQNDTYKIAWATNESVSSKRSLKVAIDVPSYTDLGFWAQTVGASVAHGKAVTLKVKVKGNLTGQGASIGIRGDNTISVEGSAEQFISSENKIAISGAFDWKEYSVKLDRVDNTTQSLTIFLILLNNTTGEVYFDDISLSY